MAWASHSRAVLAAGGPEGRLLAGPEFVMSPSPAESFTAKQSQGIINGAFRRPPAVTPFRERFMRHADDTANAESMLPAVCNAHQQGSRCVGSGETLSRSRSDFGDSPTSMRTDASFRTLRLTMPQRKTVYGFSPLGGRGPRPGLMPRPPQSESRVALCVSVADDKGSASFLKGTRRVYQQSLSRSPQALGRMSCPPAIGVATLLQG